jgi:hypothetical protein
MKPTVIAIWRGALEDFKHDRVLLLAGLMGLVAVGLFLYRLVTP